MSCLTNAAQRLLAGVFGQRESLSKIVVGCVVGVCVMAPTTAPRGCGGLAFLLACVQVPTAVRGELPRMRRRGSLDSCHGRRRVRLSREF